MLASLLRAVICLLAGCLLHRGVSLHGWVAVIVSHADAVSGLLALSLSLLWSYCSHRLSRAAVRPA